MAVNIKFIPIGLIVILVYGSASAEYFPATDEDALLYMEKRVYEQFSAANQAVDDCAKQQKNAQIDITPRQLAEFFKDAGLTNRHAMLATTHIGIRNDDLCSADARKELLFRVSAFDEAMKSVGRNIKIQTDDGSLSYTELWSMALLPTIRQARFSLDYEQFPHAVKAYMEKHFGTAPFEYMKFMNALSSDSR